MQKKKSANFGFRCVCKGARRPVMHFCSLRRLGNILLSSHSLPGNTLTRDCCLSVVGTPLTSVN